MAAKSILYLSWQIGLGHIVRDLAIVGQLRKLEPDLRIFWMAHPLSARLLEEAGEELLPESQESVDYNLFINRTGEGYQTNVVKYFTMAQHAWKQNARLLNKVIEKYSFDLIIGDEAYETYDAVFLHEMKLHCPMILIQDFLGAVSLSKSLLEKLIVYYQNAFWAYEMAHNPPNITHFYVGDLEDIPDRSWGFLLPNLREVARCHFRSLGFITRFDSEEWSDPQKARAKLGYGKNPLVICATGGTAAGVELLDLCGKAYCVAKKEIPNLRMVAVCGDLYGKKPPQLPEGVEGHSYVKDLYQHYAACDLAVVVGGGSTTTELAALHRPFIYFPLEGHFEQQELVSGHLARRNIGIRMQFSQTTPETLAGAICKQIGKEPSWQPLPAEGAKKAAQLIQGFLS